MNGEDKVEATLRDILRDVLGLSSARAAAMTPSTPLFGAIPELDSMTVAGLLAEVEDRLGIIVEDDEVDADMLGTFGALAGYVRSKASA